MGEIIGSRCPISSVSFGMVKGKSLLLHAREIIMFLKIISRSLEITAFSYFENNSTKLDP